MDDAAHPDSLSASSSSVDLQRIEIDQQLMLGQLTAGVAHELNNPIGYIASNLTSLQKYANTLIALIEQAEECMPAQQRDEWHAILKQKRWAFIRDDLPSLLADSCDGADLLKRVVADLKTLGRRGSSPEIAAPHDCVHSALSMLRHQLKRGYTVNEHIDHIEPMPVVRAQIIQAVTNIIHNAIQAMADQPGIIAISCQEANNMITISIEDDGPGIPDTIQPHIFEPRFTTKDSRSGSGLGLSIVHDIAVHHGGTVSLKPSLELAGARFEITLPRDGLAIP